MSESENELFMADSMLGKLAKWLRLMGYSVKYVSNGVSDDEVIDLCRIDSLFLLTRDKVLHERYKNSMLIESDEFHEQIKQVIQVFKPDETKYFTRCSLCNSTLFTVPISAFDGEIPESVRSLYGEVYECSGCGKVYWKGTHYISIRKTIANITGKPT
ncbi:MAG: Mut7-C RNAse domain-containing protein [Thermoplasmatales archaeon]|nr:Mut7-C RNAse domain-containing protein [Thermoplasmatales archaeon]MCW6169647.1 Mut7-C RNAse domain-containing protein [Thermoplasmatales archaeon]